MLMMNVNDDYHMYDHINTFTALTIPYITISYTMNYMVLSIIWYN